MTSPEKSPSRTHLIFIDSAVDQYHDLLNGTILEAKVIVLSASQNGITQISQTLPLYSNIEAVHIVSHGSPGCLQLGNTQLNLRTIPLYARDLRSWSSSLAQASILLYGCQVAAGDAGAEFIAQLHQLTGAKIAASAKRTGSTALGGDWDLEVTTNKIEVPLAFQTKTRESYASVLKILDGGTSNLGAGTLDPVNRYYYFIGSDSPNLFRYSIEDEELASIELPRATRFGDLAFRGTDLAIDDSGLIYGSASGFWWIVDFDNPSSYAEVPRDLSPDNNNKIGFGLDGVLYGQANTSDVFGIVNPLTGLFTEIINDNSTLRFTEISNATISFLDPEREVLYGSVALDGDLSGEFNFYEIDTSTGETTLVSTSVPGSYVNGTEWDPIDELLYYASWDGSNYDLYTWDPTSDTHSRIVNNIDTMPGPPTIVDLGVALARILFFLPIESYGGSQDENATATVLPDDNSTVQIDGNGCKEAEIDFVVGASTPWRCDFQSDGEGESLGAHFDDNGVRNSRAVEEARFFQLDGSQSYGISDFNPDDYGIGQTADGFATYEIPVGDFFTG